MSAEQSSDKELAELLKEALQSQVSIRRKKRKVESTELAINSTLEEFLDSYIIIGYDLKGDPLVMKYSQNHLQNDALQTLAIRFLTLLTQTDF
jgi:hypothetical protein